MNRERYATCLLILIMILSSVFQIQALRAEGLPSAFNGKDLTGWDVPSHNLWWKADDGILEVKSDPERQESTLWTKQQYDNFILECDFKFGGGTVDSGFFLRTSGEQIQIGISGSLKRDMTGSPYISGKGYPVEAQGVEKLLKLDDWNAMTIVAIGKNYSVWLNDSHVLSYDSDSAIKRGPVGIQLHGNTDMSIRYRRIKIAALE